MDLSIIILNYKSKGLLKQCIRGILDARLPMAHEVIAIDNHSNDGSVEMVRQEFPDVTMISSPTNVGYSAGNNLGLKRATGKYLLIVNPDVAVFAQAVQQLIDYLKEHPRVGLVVPQLANPDGSIQDSCYRFPNAWIPILRRSPLGKLPTAKKVLARYMMNDWDHQQPQAVGWALGACFMLRREAFDEVGFFDDRFFLYFEDVDYCRRLWQAGWEVHCLPAAEMVHYHRRLSADRPGLSGILNYPTRLHIQSAIKYFAKYLGAAEPPHRL